MRLSPVQLSMIELSNDGSVDSLTGALAPAAFFAHLDREAQVAERSGASLLLLSIRLSLDAYYARIDRLIGAAVLHGERFSPEETVARIERQVIQCADVLMENLRAGDYLTRYSDTGLLLLIRGSEVEFHLAQMRLKEVVISAENELFALMSAQLQGHESAGKGSVKSAASVKSQANNSREKKSIWNFSTLVRDIGESRAHLITRVDRIHFS